MDNEQKTQVLRGSLWTTQGKHRCCVRTYVKREGKHKCCVGTYRKQNEIQVLRGNLLKTQGKHTHVLREPIENARKTTVLRGNL